MTGASDPAEVAAGQARWRCESCGGELTMPAGFAEWGYACCHASMTFLGVEPVELERNAP